MNRDERIEDYYHESARDLAEKLVDAEDEIELFWKPNRDRLKEERRRDTVVYNASSQILEKQIAEQALEIGRLNDKLSSLSELAEHYDNSCLSASNFAAFIRAVLKG